MAVKDRHPVEGRQVMILWAVRIDGRWSGDGEMMYLWKQKKDAVEYTIFLHAGEVVKMTVGIAIRSRK